MKSVVSSKHILRGLWVIMALGAVGSLQARPFYRIWRGYKKPEITKEDFNKSIARVFVAATVETGAGYALRAYIPAIPKAVEGVLVPDEIALLDYDSKENYQALRATPIGKAYGDLHWKYFVQPPQDPELPVPADASRSVVPESFPETLSTLENGKAYDLLETTPDWQAGLVRIRFLERRANAASELELIKNIKTNFAPKAQGFLLLIDEHYFLTYELWENARVLKDSKMEEFYKINFGQLGKNDILATKTPRGLAGMKKLNIKEGEALNAQFDVREKAQYVDATKVDDFVKTSLEQAYTTLKDYDLEKERATDNRVERVYRVYYKDEAGVPVTHQELLKYVFEKTVLSPEGTYLVLVNGERVEL